ncbi:sigma-54-dependent transcriptional regulator [Desulfatirhabdium butyrativorans]|uniref:sigma-54-dependent transcriptional regulator n=1 Tax=Desulfatirhabdium butyrativorans TaxID=340467 RepID=UPI0003FF7EBB|nr:sigma-54 dependent transcriptional regulator [Desulfatirhabdium butyrativorans]
MARVLIIDDDEILSNMLAEVVTDMGHIASRAFTLSDGLKKAAADHFAVILLDVNLPDGSGLTKIPIFRDLCCSTEIIIITAYGDRDGAELALNNGVWDYLQKTASISDIKLSLSRAIQYAEANQRKAPTHIEMDLEGIIGTSNPLKICFSRLAQAARSDANVLITGETGTGKELFARAVHRNSSRASGPFITVDCACLTPTLVESQLFGHEKGAFTGADRKMDGMILQADGGILFLDEIGELPLHIQNAFLRVLQERHFRSVGGREEIASDFRTLAATNRDLDAMVGAGTFRSDLLYRLRGLVIALPPLREHPEDIPELASFYTTKLCNRYGIAVKGISPDFIDLISTYEWPGNVRDLVNVLESAIAEAFDEPMLYPKHLPTNLRLHFASIGPGQPAEDPVPQPLPLLKNVRESAVRETEYHYLRKLMLLAKGDIGEGCRISGLSRPQLYAQLKKHNLSIKSYNRPA